MRSLNIAILGLSITSSWGNGHATTFRGLVKELDKAGHAVTFLERNVPWYSDNRDLPNPEYCRLVLYEDLAELQSAHVEAVRSADLVIVGSYVPEGVEVCAHVIRQARGVKAFYDIDTPVTLARLENNDCAYLAKDQIARFDLYLSFTGGPTLELLEQKYRSPAARALYCSVDPDFYYPVSTPVRWDLGYLGTYSDDRQPPLEKLMLDAARNWPQGLFTAAGAQYPESVQWPANLQYLPHVPPDEHRDFYCAQRYTMNITRADMIQAGYSPSVRLFEAGACGVPIISDYWQGLDELLTPGKEILISRSAADTLAFLKELPEEERVRIGQNARKKILARHTSSRRARELVGYYEETRGS
ncbi:Spore maturation protein CgeB [Desulfonatronum thiosulfatophilum]|uniref:Spore maturation protein CgeB n=1 Tax=Desulfonatronum thiosulfatophilum TaxID=617002 RepID=A0A1G6BCJ0_9BACT|nr:glycosyltransferase [Desulfonatronum thiosulfatophilum]SDB18338.1 Spore maturation protein CgeB [Desulfonatronum thiosulfatophilum]